MTIYIFSHVLYAAGISNVGLKKNRYGYYD